MLITTKEHLCSQQHGANPIVALLFQEKNGSKYDDLEMEIHPVMKTCTNN